MAAIPGVYQQLDSTAHQFRLLRLCNPSHAAESSILSFHVSTFCLNGKLDFKALSYCWGRQKAECKILINNTPFLVRPNLHSYLMLMVEERHESLIFIDAICINQDDIDERSAQVNIMGDIYRSASEVVAWLGVLGDVYNDVHRDLPAWQHFFDLAYNACLPNQEERQRGLSRAHPERLEKELNALQLIEASTVLSPLTEQPYWFRLWVVQEIALARKLTFRYKNLRVDWRTLYACLLHVLRGPAQTLDQIPLAIRLSPTWKPMTSQFRSALQALSLLHEKDKQGLRSRDRSLLISDAVMAYSGQECIIIQDRVFGLMGMITTVVKVDYKMEVLILYVFVLIEGLFEIQGSHTLNTNIQSESSFPSKVANYTVSLAMALNQQLHKSELYFVTSEVLKYFGIKFDGVSKLWESQRLNMLAFTPRKDFGKRLYFGAISTMHQVAAKRSQLDRLSDRLTMNWGAGGKSLWDDYAQGVASTYQAIKQSRASDAASLEVIANEIPTLAHLNPEEATSLIERIVGFRDVGGANRLATTAVKYFNIEIHAILGSESTEPIQDVEVGRIAKMYLAWERILEGLSSRGLSAMYGSDLQAELKRIRESRLDAENRVAVLQSLSSMSRDLDDIFTSLEEMNLEESSSTS